TASRSRRISVFAVERQRRFSIRWRAAWRTRFSCCLMFGIVRENARSGGPRDGSSTGSPARPPAAALPMLPLVSDDLERERHLRRLERDRRRREQGKPTYFDQPGALEGWPLLGDSSDEPTMVIRPARLREDAARRGAEGAVRLGAGSAVGPSRVRAERAESARRLAVSTAIFGAATALS